MVWNLPFPIKNGFTFTTVLSLTHNTVMTSSYSRNGDDVILGLHKKPHNMETASDMPKVNETRSTADAVERPSPAYLLCAAWIDENT